MANLVENMKQPNAAGLIPNFAPNPLSRAIKTERSMGGRPVVDSHKGIGTYVRDAATQPNFSAVRRDHPEGIKQAISNSAKMQGAKAGGLVPNFSRNTFNGEEVPFIPPPDGTFGIGRTAYQYREAEEFVKWAKKNRPNWTSHEASQYWFRQSDKTAWSQFEDRARGPANLLGMWGEMFKKDRNPKNMFSGWFFGEDEYNPNLSGAKNYGKSVLGLPRNQVAKTFDQFNTEHVKNVIKNPGLNFPVIFQGQEERIDKWFEDLAETRFRM